MSRLFRHSLTLVVAAICTACSDDAPTPSVISRTADDRINKENSPFVAKKDHGVTQTVDVSVRNSLVGKWILTLSRGPSQIYAFLLEVTQEEDLSFKVNLQASFFPNSEVGAFRIKNNSINLTLKLGDQSTNFEGIFSDGTVLGNAAFDNGTILIARMIATDLNSLDQFQGAQDDPKKNAFSEAVAQEAKFKSLQNFIEEHPRSALVFTAFDELVAIGIDKQLDAKAFDELFAAYVGLSRKWGSRMELTSQRRVVNQLVRNAYLLDSALKYIKEIESSLSKKQAVAWKSFIDTSKGLALILTDDDANQEAGAGILRSVREEDSFNPRITFALAQYAEKKEKTDEALKLYAELTVVPDMERLLSRQWSNQNVNHRLPRESVARLWKQKHGVVNGLDQYLDEVYLKKITPFAKKQIESRPLDAGHRVVLCELFTGAQCPPCVAADVATVGLATTYPKSDVIVLRYHQHIPKADPLANIDSERRLLYYGGRGTPTVCLNGKMVTDNVGGHLFNAEAVYQRLCEAVELMLVEKSNIRFKLSAHAESGTFKISAVVSGLSKPSDQHRLRLIFAEDHVSFVARNGIRLHEMVVRRMISGPDGIVLGNERMSYTKSIALADLKQRLLDYLDKFEEGQGIRFSAKPLELKHLHLVAFVQNDATKEIVQTAVVPVTGFLEYFPKMKPASSRQPDKKRNPSQVSKSNDD